MALVFQGTEAAAAVDLAAVVKERLEASDTPACIAVGLVDDTTQEIFACTSGIGKVPIDRNSIFEIGSISKGFTGLLLADMVLKGEVSLDDPASKYSRPGAKLPTYEGHEITLRDLVTQTSGLPRLPPGYDWSNGKNPYVAFDADALYASLARTEITRSIGTKAEYSNFGFMWLSEMLARRGGKHFDVLLKERVLDPLGMKDTSIVQSEAQRARMATPHKLPYEPTPPWDFDRDLAGVGGVRSTLGDMMKLGSALAGRTDTPLKQAIALALEPMRPAEAPGNQTGFAWVTLSAAGIRWHNGSTGGSRSMIAVNPGTKTAAVVLVDAAVPFDDLPMHLVDGALQMQRKHVALPIDAATREQYVGRYDFGAGHVLRVFVDGDRLMTQMTGQGSIELGREGTDKFFARGVEAALEFNRNAGKAIEAVTLRQNGHEIRAPRMP